MKKDSRYHGRRFPAAIVGCAVRWRFRFILADQLCSFPAAKADIPELAGVKHVFVTAARENDRAENTHQPPRECEQRMRGFRDPKHTQAFLTSFGPIRQHFALKRHPLRASLHRKLPEQDDRNHAVARVQVDSTKSR